jgi:hypothetical protein
MMMTVLPAHPGRGKVDNLLFYRRARAVFTDFGACPARAASPGRQTRQATCISTEPNMRGQSELAARLDMNETDAAPASTIWHAAAPGAGRPPASAANENGSARFTFAPERLAGWCAS